MCARTRHLSGTSSDSDASSAPADQADMEPTTNDPPSGFMQEQQQLIVDALVTPSVSDADDNSWETTLGIGSFNGMSVPAGYDTPEAQADLLAIVWASFSENEPAFPIMVFDTLAPVFGVWDPEGLVWVGTTEFEMSSSAMIRRIIPMFVLPENALPQVNYSEYLSYVSENPQPFI